MLDHAPGYSGLDFSDRNLAHGQNPDIFIQFSLYPYLKKIPINLHGILQAKLCLL